MNVLQNIDSQQLHRFEERERERLGGGVVTGRDTPREISKFFNIPKLYLIISHIYFILLKSNI